MPKHDDIPTTDTSEIEALIARLDTGQLREGDAQTLGRLLRTFLSLVHLLQRKYAINGSCGPHHAGLPKRFFQFDLDSRKDTLCHIQSNDFPIARRDQSSFHSTAGDGSFR